MRTQGHTAMMGLTRSRQNGARQVEPVGLHHICIAAVANLNVPLPSDLNGCDKDGFVSEMDVAGPTG